VKSFTLSFVAGRVGYRLSGPVTEPLNDPVQISLVFAHYFPAIVWTPLTGCVITPHTAGNTDGTLQRRATFCAGNLDRVANGLTPECLLT
jgi:hypothetical protein